MDAPTPNGIDVPKWKFFKHHRKVEHRNGHATREVAPLKKSIYSLIDLREILLGWVLSRCCVRLRRDGGDVEEWAA
jgi:hypothetical protein